MKSFSRRLLVTLFVLVFFAGWFSYAGYLYSNQLLIVPIEGSIINFEPTTIALHNAMINPKVKAVVLYMNTPGGWADSCLEIAIYVEALAKVKPVIAVMGPQCTSGGYIIASFASHIFTHQNTMTGGIGVLAIWVDLTEYYQKQGIKVWVWATGEEKDFGADWRTPTPEEQTQIQGEVDALFEVLLDLIQDNRNLSNQAMTEISTGKLFSGSRAVEIGLADEIGDIIDAMDKARSITGIWKYIIVTPDMKDEQRFLKALF